MGFFFRKGSASAAAAAAAQTLDSPPVVVEECLCDNLQAGDHVFRWTTLLIYPIQIHGIVLSAGAGIVTIIDFGLSSTSSGSHWRRKDNRILELAREKRRCRLNIITLTEKKEVDQWHKVNYGESLLSGGKWAKIKSWFRRKKRQEQRDSSPDGSTTTAEALLGNAEGEGLSTVDDETESNYSASSERLSVCSESPSLPPDEVFAEVLAWLQQQEQQKSNHCDNKGDETMVTGAAEKLMDEQEGTDSNQDDVSNCQEDRSGKQRKKSNRGGSEAKKQRKASTSPRLPKSDPPVIVLSRVRYLLSEGGESALPPHHLLFANSECLAVWCKTGRFSTIQSQILLHSTAIGNAKTATMVALMVSAQTVTVTSTVQSAGFWGWLGIQPRLRLKLAY